MAKNDEQKRACKDCKHYNERYIDGCGGKPFPTCNINGLFFMYIPLCLLETGCERWEKEDGGR